MRFNDPHFWGVRSSDPHFWGVRSSDHENTDQDGNFIIYPRELDITWGSDKRYWNLPRLYTRDEDSFAELKQVCWLEVTGSTPKDIEVGKSYKVGFKVSLRPDAFGWDDCNIYIMAKIGKKGTFSFKQLSLKNESTNNEPFIIPKDNDSLIIDVTDQNLNPSSSDKNLYFGLYEVWTKRWKGGLRIHHAFVSEIKPDPIKS